MNKLVRSTIKCASVNGSVLFLYKSLLSTEIDSSHSDNEFSSRVEIFLRVSCYYHGTLRKLAVIWILRDLRFQVF
jgi:hypothetical protein